MESEDRILKVSEDISARKLLSFSQNDGEKTFDDRCAIILAIASLDGSKSLLGNSSVETLLATQWLQYASNSIFPACSNGDSMNEIYERIHDGLATNAFIAGGLSPTIADWSLFALLIDRIHAFVPSVAAKYYRLIRWSLYLEHLVKDVFETSSFDMKAIQEALEAVGLPKSEVLNKKAETEGKKEKKPKGKKADTNNVASHPFARVDLRVGKIIKVQKHPEADRLYIETVDLGEDEPRIVVSGLVEHVPLEQLQDRLCVFICNLKPAKLCKTLSSAMLLVGKSNEDPNLLYPLSVPEGCKAGDRIYIEGVSGVPDQVIKPKEKTWSDVCAKLALLDGKVCFDDEGTSKVLLVNSNAITCTKIANGIIS